MLQLTALAAVVTFIAGVEPCNIIYNGCMNGSCYTVSNEMVPWQNASERCKATCNGRLAVVENRETQAFLLNLTESEVWLGGREVNLSDWVWIDQQREQEIYSIIHQPETMNSEKFQPGVCLERKNGSGGNLMAFPWIDREYLWTAGVLCEADISRTVCNDTSSFIWAHTTRWGDIKEGKCVFFSNGKATEYTWFEGHALCQKADGELLKIDNGTVQQSLSNKLNRNGGSKYHWIGLVHSEWKWVTGASIPSLFYKEFAQKEEIYRMEPVCLALRGSVADVKKSWVMKKCVDSKSNICEYPKDSPMTTTFHSMTSDVTVTATMNMEEKGDENDLPGGTVETTVNQLPTDYIVGIGVGGAAFVIIFAVVIVVTCWFRRRSSEVLEKPERYDNTAVNNYDPLVVENINQDGDTGRIYTGLLHMAPREALPDGQITVILAESNEIRNVDDAYVSGNLNGINRTNITTGTTDACIYENEQIGNFEGLKYPFSHTADMSDEPKFHHASSIKGANNTDAVDRSREEDNSKLYEKPPRQRRTGRKRFV